MIWSWKFQRGPFQSCLSRWILLKYIYTHHMVHLYSTHFNLFIYKVHILTPWSFRKLVGYYVWVLSPGVICFDAYNILFKWVRILYTLWFSYQVLLTLFMVWFSLEYVFTIIQYYSSVPVGLPLLCLETVILPSILWCCLALLKRLSIFQFFSSSFGDRDSFKSDPYYHHMMREISNI